MDEKSRLFKDLNEKLDRLRWTLEQPELFITEYFASIRNQIDLETERFIQELQNDDSTVSASDSDTARSNSTRTRFIEFLDKNEANLFAKLIESSAFSSASGILSILEKRVEEFSTSIEFKGLNEMEEAYLQLALDIIEETNEVEKRLLDNQTFAYVPWKIHYGDIKIGNLVYLSEEYLNRDELSCLRQTVDFDLALHVIEASLNASLLVCASRPLVLTSKVLIIMTMVRHLNSSESSAGKILYLESPLQTTLDIPPDDKQFYQGLIMHPETIFNDLSRKSLDAVQLKEIDFGSNRFFCDMSNNKLKRFEISDSLIQSFDTLDLSENQLETLDVEQLAKANKLRCLSLFNACLPDTKFSLDFLSSLTELVELELTLPDATIDSKVLNCLRNLMTLRLHSANCLNSDIERPRLTHEHFKQLSVMPNLTTLELFNFKIESIQREMLEGFARLSDLSLIDNEILLIEDGESNLLNYFRLAKNTFRSICARMYRMYRGVSQDQKLNLSCNRTEHLPSGVFDKLSSMRLVRLNNNSIRHISRGLFNQLAEHVDLFLQNDLIESIETDSFKGCRGFSDLFLGNCTLKSIDNTIFTGLESLMSLDLSHNQIEAFEVVNENCRSSIKGIMSPVEYELVKRSLFVETEFLSRLYLKGNKMEKLDLNCFCNLTRLRDLDVSSNQINELNEEIRPGVLSSLKYLDLSDNQLTRVSRNSFGESRNLSKLNLSKNRIERLDEDFFEAFNQLTQLHLQNNNLSMKITAQTFAQCAQLNYLNLIGNPEVSVEIGALSRLESLNEIHLEIRRADSSSIELLTSDFYGNGINQSLSLINSSIESFDDVKIGNKARLLNGLDLSQNQIRSINNKSFSCFDRLFQLDLSSNLIETLDDPDMFQHLTELRTLGLRGNQLKRIHRRVFNCLSKLESLDLSYNPALSNIDAGVFRGLFSLGKLNLAGNNIVLFDLNLLLRSCTLLESLDLSDNQLDHESVNEASMSGITAQNLRELMLANNRLEKMDFVRHLYRLEMLDLSENKIESVTSPLGVNLLGRLMKLKHVNLSSNHIESLNIKAIFSHLKYQLKFLDLSNNQFNSN